LTNGTLKNYSVKKKILVIGQTPPPYYGQAMMTDRLVQANFDSIQIYHVRMAFSKSLSSVGNFELGKVFHLCKVVIQALLKRYESKPTILYYMPGGTTITPVVRDILILMVLRLFFKKTVFHFRAAGIAETMEGQPYLLKKLAKWAYRSPDLAIHLSERNPNDGAFVKAKNIAIIPNGLEDAAAPFLPIYRPLKKTVNILYVGLIQESKGVMVLLEAARLLKEQNFPVQVTIVGEFGAAPFKEKLISFCAAHSLESVVHLAGPKKGNDKWRYFLEADIFCFPSFFESESFGNVVVEAMMFELPVVASDWRGIPDIVRDNQTGFLSEIRNHRQIAAQLASLIQNPELRLQMGKAGRKVYEETYQIDTFLKLMETKLVNV
jgi:glycosyltransferase involved in cell wall biosynthesis